MNKYTGRLIIMAFMVLAVTFSGFGQKRLNKVINSGELRVGMTGNQPPFSMHNMQDSLFGYEVDLAYLIAEALEVKLTIVEMPFSELFTALNEGKVDVIMSGVTITPKRNLSAMFAGPYIVSGKSILTRSPKLAAVTELADLNSSDIKLSALKGSTSEDFVRKWLPKAQLQAKSTHDEAVKLVVNNQVDAFFGDYPACVYAMFRYPLIDLSVLEEPLTIEPIGIAMPADAFLLQNLLQNYLNSLQILGVLDLLEYQWFETSDWLPQVKM